MLVKVESSINIIKNGDKLIMDPENQIIIINPDEFATPATNLEIHSG